jgi:hypothetical protein
VLGFNSWNVFACKVTEDLMRDTMDLFVSLGLRDAGCMLAQSPGHHHQSLTHCPPGTDVNATTTTTTIIIATTTCHLTSQPLPTPQPRRHVACHCHNIHGVACFIVSDTAIPTALLQHAHLQVRVRWSRRLLGQVPQRVWCHPSRPRHVPIGHEVSRRLRTRAWSQVR